MQLLLDKGISTRRGIMTSHRETAYKNHKLIATLPISEDASDQSIVLPLYVPMSKEDVDYVVNTIQEIFNSFKK
jgi:dTDP-4-amino-4,6-dideoxygalactose transaminase